MDRRRLRTLAFALLVGACGSRTGLFGLDDLDGEEPDVVDGGPSRRDAGFDADEPDADDPDAPIPLIDARAPQDVVRNDCPDADATLIYVITTTYQLYSFYPPDGTFRLIGNIACPASPGATPFSMAVDRRGTAYVLFTDERLYRVSTRTAACTATAYRPRQSDFGVFGMGFATINGGPQEALFIAGDDRTDGAEGLARIDPATFQLRPIGQFSRPIRMAELTGTGDGRLFAFYRKGLESPPSYIGEVNPSSGRLVGEKALAGVDQGQGWAFAFWGGDFYVFHAPTGNSIVSRYRPSDDSVRQVASLPTIVVGAGVSTCAPPQ